MVSGEEMGWQVAKGEEGVSWVVMGMRQLVMPCVSQGFCKAGLGNCFWEVSKCSRGSSSEGASSEDPGSAEEPWCSRRGAGVVAASADTSLQGTGKKYRAEEAPDKSVAGCDAAQGSLLLS